MENLWQRFDNIAKPDDVMEAKSRFEPIEPGTYNMMLETIEPTVAKTSGLPMLALKFRLIESNKVMFVNQMLQNLNYPDMTAVNIAQAVSLVSGLLGEEIEFEGMAKFAELIKGIPTPNEYLINVSYGAKDTEKNFPNVRVVEDTDDIDFDDDMEDDSIPF